MIARTQATSGYFVLALALAVFPSLDCRADSDVMFDKEVDGLREVATVGADALGTHILEFQKTLANDDRAPAKILVIRAFADAGDASQTLSGKGHTEVTYDEAVARLHEAQARSTFRMTRLISIDGNTVIQSIDGPNLSLKVSHGVDPRLFVGGGKTCEILELYFTRLPRSLRADGRNPPVVKVYLRTNALPDLTESRSITNILQEKLHHEHLTVHIRTDSWFLDSSEFPLWYPFELNQMPPSFEEYRSRGEIFCNASEKEVTCANVARIRGNPGNQSSNQATNNDTIWSNCGSLIQLLSNKSAN